MYTKKSQWDKPTAPVFPVDENAPTDPPPGYEHGKGPAPTDTKKNPYEDRSHMSHPAGSSSTQDEDARLAAKLQAEEDAKARGGPTPPAGYAAAGGGAADSYAQGHTGGQGQAQDSFPSDLPPRDGSRGSKDRGFLGKLFGKGKNPQGGQGNYGGGYPQQQQNYYQGPPQQQYGGYPQQGPPMGAYGQPGYGGGYPPQGGYGGGYGGGYQQGGYQQQGKRPGGSGMGMGLAGGALGLGAGVIGGALIADAIQDHDQHEYQEGYRKWLLVIRRVVFRLLLMCLQRTVRIMITVVAGMIMAVVVILMVAAISRGRMILYEKRPWVWGGLLEHSVAVAINESK